MNLESMVLELPNFVNKLTYNESNSKDLIKHFEACNFEFQYKLKKRVNISEYAEKLVEKSQKIELWNSVDLIALLAFYVDSIKKVAYVSSFSVDVRFENNGLGKFLFLQLESNLRQNEIQSIYLEVSSKNNRALKFYNDRNFKLISTDQGYHLLEKTLL